MSYLLKIRGYKIINSKFIAGELIDENQESIFLSARRLANKLSIIEAENTINRNKLLSFLNLNYGNNTIKLYIAKYLQSKIEYYVLRVFCVKFLNHNYKSNSIIYFKSPYTFNSKILNNNFKRTELIYYSNFFEKYANIFKTLIVIFGRDIRWVFRYIFSNNDINEMSLEKPSVLSVSEDTLNEDKSLRSQIYWVDENNHADLYNKYVINFNNSHITKNHISNMGVHVICSSLFIRSIKFYKRNKHILDLQKQIDKLFRNFIFCSNSIDRLMYLVLFNLFRESKKISSLSMYLNSKVYLFKETHSVYSDAIQLISKKLELKQLVFNILIWV